MGLTRILPHDTAASVAFLFQPPGNISMGASDKTRYRIWPSAAAHWRGAFTLAPAWVEHQPNRKDFFMRILHHAARWRRLALPHQCVFIPWCQCGNNVRPSAVAGTRWRFWDLAATRNTEIELFFMA